MYSIHKIYHTKTNSHMSKYLPPLPSVPEMKEEATLCKERSPAPCLWGAAEDTDMLARPVTTNGEM